MNDDYVYHANALSASRIKKHTACPKQYEYRYVLKEDSTKAKTGYAELGTLVHTSIEEYLEDRPDERSQGALLSGFKQNFFRLENDPEVETDAIDDKQRKDGLGCLETAARFVAKQTDTEIRDLEKFSDYHVDVNDIQRWMVGFMDVCTQNEVWDWKTGRIREDETPIEETIQGAVYMAAFHHEYGHLPERIRFVYLKEEEVRDLTCDQELWQRMLVHARQLIDSEQRDEFPADPEEGKCYWCDYSLICPEPKTSPGQITEALEDQPDLWESV